MIGTGDFDNSGKSDILFATAVPAARRDHKRRRHPWQNTVSGDVMALEMTAGNVLSTVNLNAPASSFRLVTSTGGG